MYERYYQRVDEDTQSGTVHRVTFDAYDSRHFGVTRGGYVRFTPRGEILEVECENGDTTLPQEFLDELWAAV